MMFEISRRSQQQPSSPARTLMNWITSDPWLRNFGEFAEREGAFGDLAVDVSEKGHNVIVRASLPGFKKDEVDIQVQDNALVINAEHSEEKETEGERFHRRERTWGAVSRRIPLPVPVDQAKATAELKDGVLTVTIPESETARPKKIAVK